MENGFPKSKTVTTLLIVIFSIGFISRTTFADDKGKEFYRAACAACHGMDGKGSEPDKTGLTILVPDFSDCTFATREPDADWFAITHSGGPARGFDPMMPAFGDALQSEEIQRVLNYVRTFCRNRSWPRGELNLPRALVTEKAYPEDEAVLTTTIDAEEAGSVDNEIVYERRIASRSQFEIALPFGIQKSDANNWSGGIGDIALGLKHALYHSLEQGSIFSLIGEVVFPTGDSDKGFGKGVTIIEPVVAFGQILPSDSFFQFQGGFELSTDRDQVEHEAFWRGVIGRSFTQGRFGRTWSPMIEILGARELQGSSSAHWDVLPQVQVTLSRRQHIMLNAGIRVPINDAESRSTQMMVYILWDWFDGGFFDGW
jgi:hypothetical protein